MHNLLEGRRSMISRLRRALSERLPLAVSMISLWLMPAMLSSLLTAPPALAQSPALSTLTLPVKETVMQSLGQMRRILHTHHATFHTQEGVEYILATVGSVEVLVSGVVPSAPRPILLLTCGERTGSAVQAERLCSTMQHQYLHAREP